MRPWEGSWAISPTLSSCIRKTGCSSGYDQGELILGKLSPKGFDVISRAKLLDTSENTRGRNLLWCHPAFANRRAYVHNGKEMICIELGKQSA